jgi:hypothetical protein
MSALPTGEMPFALMSILAGKVPAPQTWSAVAPFVLDVLCAQDAAAVEQSNDAIAAVVRGIARNEPTELAVRAVKALRAAPCLANCTKASGVSPAESRVMLGQETADALTLALNRFTAAREWHAVHETLATVHAMSNRRALPVELVKAGVHAVKAGAKHQGVPYGDRAAVWRHAAMLARQDVEGAFLDDLCAVCASSACSMATRMDQPHADDLSYLDSVMSGLYWNRKERNGVVTSALLRAGGLETTMQLLLAHGVYCVGYSAVLGTFWHLVNCMNDATFTQLVTAGAGLVQRLQEFSGWQGSAWVTARARIQKLGVARMPKEAADKLAAVNANLAEVAANLAAAVTRAEKAEAEVAHLRGELNGTVQPGLHKVLAVHGAGTPRAGAGAGAQPAASASGTRAGAGAGAHAVQSGVGGASRTPSILFIVGDGGAGKTTLGKQLAASGKFRVMDDRDYSWLCIRQALASAAAENEDVAIIINCTPRDDVVTWCRDYGHRMHWCHVVKGPTGAANAVTDLERVPKLDGVCGQAVLRRSRSSSAADPAWTIHAVTGRGGWVDHVRIDYSMETYVSTFVAADDPTLSASPPAK